MSLDPKPENDVLDLMDALRESLKVKPSPDPEPRAVSPRPSAASPRPCPSCGGRGFVPNEPGFRERDRACRGCEASGEVPVPPAPDPEPQPATPYVEVRGGRATPWGQALQVQIGRTDDAVMTWREVWEAFATAWPGRWALQIFPPGEQLVDAVNAYHLYVLPDGVSLVDLSIATPAPSPAPEPPTDRIHVPWTPEQVAALNVFQKRDDVHPITCAYGCGALTATKWGWRCGCGYGQNWAHSFMADPNFFGSEDFLHKLRASSEPDPGAEKRRLAWAIAREYEEDLALEVYRLAARDLEHDRFLAGLLALLGPDREALDREGKPVGDAMLDSVRELLEGFQRWVETAGKLQERVRESEADYQARTDEMRLRVAVLEEEIAIRKRQQDEAAKTIRQLAKGTIEEREARISVLEEENRRLRESLSALVAAEDRFVSESGVPLDDAVVEAVERVRPLLTLRAEADTAAQTQERVTLLIETVSKGATYIALLEERVKEVESERDSKEATLAMAVSRLGGTVEGHPTHRINFLQRIDELVAKEAQVRNDQFPSADPEVEP